MVFIYIEVSTPIAGLVKQNKNYENIIKILNSTPTKIGVFVFGEVDLAFYYFYKKYIQHKSHVFNTIVSNLKKYVALIASLPNIEKKIIINIPPPFIATSKYIIALEHYINLPPNANIDTNDIKYSTRLKKCIDANIIIKDECEKYNIKFINSLPYMLDKKNQLHNIFILHHNRINVHGNFEYMLLLYLHLYDFDLPKSTINSTIKNIKKCQNKYIESLYKKQKYKISDIKKIICNIKTFNSKFQCKNTN